MITDLEKKYIKHNFPWSEFGHIFFNKELKNDYEGQCKRICVFFDLKSVFEYETIINKRKDLIPDLKTFSEN